MRTLLLISALIGIAGLPLEALAQARPAGVSTEIVSVKEMAETVSVFGQVVAGRESAVAARVTGVVQEVPMQVGDRVFKGDILTRLDTELFEIQLAQAEAEISIAEAGISVATARLDRAEKAFRRAESLMNNSTISEAQLEDRAGDYAEALGSRQEAEARIKAARTAVSRARYDLENATVYAPFDGVVLQLATEVGQFVAAGSQVATLVDTGAMEVEANVPARYVDALRPEQPVQAATDVGGTLTLGLRAILPTEFSATRTRPVLFSILAPDSPVAVGQSVTLEVPVSAPRDVVVVPKDALVQARDGWSVFLNVDGKATPRTVRIGAALGDDFEVLSGLSPGDEVVVRGNERLRPGQDILPAPSPSPRQADPSQEGATSQPGDGQSGEVHRKRTRVANQG